MRLPANTHSLRSLTPALFLAAIVVLGLTLAGCSGDSQNAGTSTTLAPPDAAEAGYQIIEFATEDALTLSGRLYGSGSRAILLCHMYPADQTSWHDQAVRLAALDYMVLTFDFRGYGDSEGDKDIQYLDRDVLAAVSYLRSVGAQEVVVVGASMGGTACLKAAAQLQTLSSVRVAGVATYSAPVEFEGLSAEQAVPELQIPMLFVAAEDDEGAAGARNLQSLSGGLGELVLLPGGDHGTDLFTGDQAEAAWQSLLGFVRSTMPVGG